MEEPSQVPPEVNLLARKFDQEDIKDVDVKIKGLIKTDQRDKETIGPLTLLKGDLNHFKDEVLNVFRIGLPKEKDKEEDCKGRQEEGLGGNLDKETKSGDTEDKNRKVKDWIDQPEDGEREQNMLGGKSQLKQSDMMSTSNTGGPTCESCPATGLVDQKPKPEEPPQEKSELREDEVTHIDQKNHEDDNIKIKGLLKTNQNEKRTSNPLTSLKEDLLKVFKLEDQMSRQTKDDSTEVKDDCSSSADPKMRRTVEKSDNRLSLFIEDLTSALEISLAKEKDMKEGPGKNDKPFRKLFRRDQKPLRISAKDEDKEDVKNRLSETKEEQLDSGCKENLSEKEEVKEKHKTGKTSNTEGGTDQRGDGEPAETPEMISDLDTRTPGGFLKNLFRRDQKPLMGGQEVKLSDRKGGQVDTDFRGILTNNRKGWMDIKLDPNMSEDKSETSFSETQQRRNIMSTSNMVRPIEFSGLTAESGNQKPTESKSNVCEDDPTNTRTSDQEDLREEDLKEQDLLKINQWEKKSISPLSLLKEDFNQLKDDFRNVFRIGLPKEKDKEEQNQEKPDAEKTNNNVKEKMEGRDVDLNMPEETSEMSFCEDMMFALSKGRKHKLGFGGWKNQIIRETKLQIR